MLKRMLVMLAAMIAIVAALGFVKFRQIQTAIAQGAAYQPPPEAVTTIVASEERWPSTLTAIGTLAAVRGVTVSADLPGVVDRIAFESGQFVQEGDVLALLDTRQERAQLAAAEAQLDLARVNYERMEGLLGERVIARAEFDRANAEQRQAEARVREISAAIERKTIRAPFSGKLGITTVNPGQYINPGDAIVTLQAIDPIYADFYLPQQQLGQLQVGQTVVVDTNAFASRTFDGKIRSINPRVDNTTRNVQIEATVDNRERKLLPGMYANVKIDAGNVERYLTLPQTAITYNPYGATVFVVKPGEHKDAQGKTMPVAQQVFVTPGPTRGDQVAILKGIAEGTQVVTSGQLKLKNGTPLVIDNRVQPADNPNPTPQEQ